MLTRDSRAAGFERKRRGGWRLEKVGRATAGPGGILRNVGRWVAALGLVVCACGPGRAQTATALSQVKKVYVEAFGDEESSGKVRERVMEEVRKRGKWEVVATASEADAVLKGSCTIWVTGYQSNDPHSPSNTRRPVLTGFLSAEVVGKAGEPLWSYLVTPSKFRVGTITEDLADHLVKKLVEDARAGKGSGASSPATGTRAEVSVSAAGATFPAPLYQRWFESFAASHAGAHLTYNGVGSEEGIRLLRESKVDFAGSDVPLNDEQATGIWHFATVVGAVVPIYNLKGLERPLNFTPEALAGIYLGKIRKWNDKALREANRGVRLPDSEIVVVHRSDGSGTTFVWTDYLSKVNEEWKGRVGAASTVQWPVGEGAERNEGVAAMVGKTASAIGYVEQVYALRHELSVGAVRNAAGSAAAGEMKQDFRVSITNAAGEDAYPISSFTWWLMPKEAGAEKRAAETELVQWMLTSGQRECSALGYAPLPKGVATRELQAVREMK